MRLEQKVVMCLTGQLKTCAGKIGNTRFSETFRIGVIPLFRLPKRQTAAEAAVIKNYYVGVFLQDITNTYNLKCVRTAVYTLVIAIG
jgi:hypothetical protein